MTYDQLNRLSLVAVWLAIGLLLVGFSTHWWIVADTIRQIVQVSMLLTAGGLSVAGVRWLDRMRQLDPERWQRESLDHQGGGQ